MTACAPVTPARVRNLVAFVGLAPLLLLVLPGTLLLVGAALLFAGVAVMAMGPLAVVPHAGRTFLEVERFDRHGAHGRSAVVSLETIDAALLGSSSTHWPELAGRLHAARLLEAADVGDIETVWWFGKLIRNTDMHLGNLSFEPAGRLRMTPVHDMLPMAYAPLAGGEVPPRAFDAALPMPEQRERWLKACAAALDFWRRAADDERIGAVFRVVGADNAAKLARLRVATMKKARPAGRAFVDVAQARRFSA